ncbi:hypothetical protein UPYG_G00105400 [Umbra pygmaea]|uniref:TNFR-Cys domain-containing protein n=1 Tax=Umbra pygmaea TaxID=75934 RepID=A0ABD0XRH0_UMBPY
MGTLSLVMFFGVVGALAASKTERAVQVSCDSGEFTNDGECCDECPPGEGVVTKCGATQTVCSQCLDSETYSENYSHLETCSACTMCTGLMRMQRPCTDSNDAICVCNYNYYLGEVSGRCEHCTMCPVGQGVLEHCNHDHDTVCEECIDDTYSDRESSLDPCLPCTICDDGEIEENACTTVSDTHCYNPLLPNYTSTTTRLDPSLPSFPEAPAPDSSSSPSPGGETTTSRPSYPWNRMGPGFNENLIPIYCSILAAVVVGLVAYIVFKRWNSCKKNKQPANNRQAAAANQTVTPEGEKLHSDSGISVDSQSLQEQHAAQAQVQTQPLQAPHHSQGQDQIVVRMDKGPDSPSPQV